MADEFDAHIFDCDGTLADTMPAHFVAWRTTLDALGIELTEQRFYALAGVPAPDIIAMLAAEYGLTLDADRIAHEKESLFARSIPAVLPIDRVVALVHEHHGHTPLAIASGSPRWSVEAVLSHLGIADRFDAMICGGEVPRPKPAPDIFLAAAAAMGVAPTRCVVYEDSDLGLDGARAAGMAAIDVRPWYMPPRG